jgi:xylulokinase
MNQGVIAGIDAGTSKVKTTLFALDGTLLREVSADVSVTSPAAHHAEIDLSEVLSSVIRSLSKLLEGYEDKLLSIGLSVTSPTLVLLDRNLNAIRPGIVYLDNRSAQLVERYTAELGGGQTYFDKVGNFPSPSTCVAATINWLRTYEPESWRRVYKIGFLNTFLAAQLTGNLAVDPTVASYSGLMNVGVPDRWDEELLSFFDVSHDLLPEVKWASCKVGGLKSSVAEAIGVASGVPVALGGADSATTSFALGVMKHGEVVQSMGTSEVTTFCHATPDFSAAFMNRSHVWPGLWLSHGAMSTTGGAISWVRSHVFPEIASEAELETEALRSQLGCGGVVFLPYLCGERSPIFDSKATGVFFGLGLTSSRRDLIRAVFESAAYGVRQIYKIGADTWKVQPEYIRCVGGASKSPLAVQLRADALNLEFRSIEADAAASYGAALLGAISAGAFGDVSALPCLKTFGKVVKPTAEGVAHFEKHSAIYNRLYPQLKDVMHLSHQYCQ